MNRVVLVIVAFCLLLVARSSASAQSSTRPFWCNWWATKWCVEADRERNEIERERIEAERRLELFTKSRRTSDERALLSDPTEVQKYIAVLPNGAKAEVAVLYASGNKAIVVVHGQYESRGVKLCKDGALNNNSNDRCNQVRKALFNARDLYQGDTAGQIRLTLIGHADIQRLSGREVDIDNDTREECVARNLLPQSNDCIALARAFDLRPLVASNLFDSTNRTVVRLSFDPDPFMANTDKALRSSLYKQLQLVDIVEGLRNDLGIGSDWTQERLRADEEIQRRLKSNPRLLEKLGPFRSVVVVFEPCTNMPCQ